MTIRSAAAEGGTNRRTKATLIYRRTGNLRAVQLLLGHKKMESTVRYLGIEVDDALAIALSKSKSEVLGQSGHCSARLLAALRAKTGLMHCSKHRDHSITSSASASSVGGNSPVKAGHETELNWVAARFEDDRDGCGRRLRCECRRSASRGYHGYLTMNEFGCHPR